MRPCLDQVVIDLGEGGGDILYRVGQVQHHIGQHHDADGIVEGQQLVDSVPEEHDADDEHDARQHLRQQTHPLHHLSQPPPGRRTAITTAVPSTEQMVAEDTARKTLFLMASRLLGVVNSSI